MQTISYQFKGDMPLYESNSNAPSTRSESTANSDNTTYGVQSIDGFVYNEDALL